jgi:hypothetical protein
MTFSARRGPHLSRSRGPPDPTTPAAVAASRASRPASAQAIPRAPLKKKKFRMAAQPSATYELGLISPSYMGSRYPVYVRGQTYLLLRQGKEAATEFQQFLDHRGIVMNFPLGALAHLGVARAYALSGDAAKAKTAYQDFFALWKDADPGIPILKEAKAEYAKLN